MSMDTVKVKGGDLRARHLTVESILTKDFLVEQYITLGKSKVTIAKENGFHQFTVANYLRHFAIPTRRSSKEEMVARRKAYLREYRQINKNKIRAYNISRVDKNREHKHRYAMKNRDKINAKNKEYQRRMFLADPERFRERHRKWRFNGRDKINALAKAKRLGRPDRDVMLAAERVYATSKRDRKASNATVNPVEVENLFKVEDPCTDLASKGYYGFMGVVRRDTKSDRVQCHLCGKWYKSLLHHVIQYHKMTSLRYRIKFGLQLNFPLCSLAKSAKLSAHARTYLTPNHVGPISKATRKLMNRRIKYSHNCAAYLNKLGNCPEQVVNRYLLVCDKVGREATITDLLEHDSRLVSTLGNRYGGLIKFKKDNGFDYKSRYIKVSDFTLINDLRNLFIKLDRLPLTKDLRPNGCYSYATYISRFGSWRRSLAKAGLLK